MENKKVFTKSDLEVGMVVETTNGRRYLIFEINDKKIFLGEYVYIKWEKIKDDLTSNFDKGDEIVKVFKYVTAPCFSDIFCDANLKLIYEKETDFVIMTKDEIKEKLGIDNNKELIIEE